MAKKTPVKSASTTVERNGASTNPNGAPAREVLVADIIIKNAPDPVFVSDLEGKILQANDAVSELLGFRPDEVVEQSLSRFIAPRRPANSRQLYVRSSSTASRETPSSTRAAPRAR